MVNKISKKIIFVSMVLVLLAIGVYAYIQPIPDPGHGGDKVLVLIDGFTMTLQEAIDYDFLVEGASSPTQSYTTVLSGVWQNASDIYVSVDGAEMTLQEAIGTTGLTGSVLSSYGSNIIMGHSADEIWVSIGISEMTLQDAINSGEFCVSDCSCASGICVGSVCPDGCGGICDGILEPDCSCADDFCITMTCIDSNCGTTCEGEKTCCYVYSPRTRFYYRCDSVGLYYNPSSSVVYFDGQWIAGGTDCQTSFTRGGITYTRGDWLGGDWLYEVCISP